MMCGFLGKFSPAEYWGVCRTLNVEIPQSRKTFRRAYGL